MHLHLSLSLRVRTCDDVLERPYKTLENDNPRERQQTGRNCLTVIEALVAEWIHFTLFGIIIPTIKLKV